MVQYFLSAILFSIFLTGQPSHAQAQSTAAPAATAPAASSTTMAPAMKAKKPRSEKQKKNDEIMRACGAEWKAAKAAGTTNGQKWRAFLKDCRKKKKDEQKM